MVKNLVLKGCSSNLNEIVKKEYNKELEVPHIKIGSNFNKFEEEEADSKNKIREIGRNSRKYTPFVKEKKNIVGLLIYLSIRTDENENWYKIDPNGTSSSQGNQTQILSPICSISDHVLPHYYRTIGYDSKLYIIGGYTRKGLGNLGHVRPKTFVCDTLSKNPVWEECSSMKSCKIGPQLAVVDGEIFAIGSRSSITFQFKKPYAEVFNPSNNKWTALPSPPRGINLCNVSDSVFLRDRDEIILFPSGSHYGPHDAYGFNVKSHSWTPFSDPFRISTDNTTSSVAVGDVIFRLQENRLYACDMSQPKPIGRRVYGLEKEIKSLMSGTGHLCYIGNGKLCLTWCSYSKEHCNMTDVACLKFWVEMCNEKRRLIAVIDRCDHYLANGRSSFCDCVAM